ncbi:hypothetical protein CR513_33162, partial [Mucuna pruriens]
LWRGHAVSHKAPEDIFKGSLAFGEIIQIQTQLIEEPPKLFLLVDFSNSKFLRFRIGIKFGFFSWFNLLVNLPTVIDFIGFVIIFQIVGIAPWKTRCDISDVVLKCFPHFLPLERAFGVELGSNPLPKMVSELILDPLKSHSPYYSRTKPDIAGRGVLGKETQIPHWLEIESAKEFISGEQSSPLKLAFGVEFGSNPFSKGVTSLSSMLISGDFVSTNVYSDEDSFLTHKNSTRERSTNRNTHTRKGFSHSSGHVDVLIKWSNVPNKDNTWEYVDQIQANFLAFHFKDKVQLIKEGIDWPIPKLSLKVYFIRLAKPEATVTERLTFLGRFLENYELSFNDSKARWAKTQELYKYLLSK